MARRWRAVVAGAALVAATSTAAGSTSVASAFAGSSDTIAAASRASSQRGSCDAHGEPIVKAEEEQIIEHDFAACSNFGSRASYSGDLYASMEPAGEPETLIGPLRAENISGSTWNTHLLTGGFYIKYCSLPGGSDLPGADFRYELAVNEPAQYLFAFQYTLPDDKTPPVLSGGSTPPSGTRVHPGQVISVHITATEPSDQGPQEGIQDIQLLGPDGLIDSKSYGNHPTACDTSRLSKTLTTSYTVPDNPPATVRLTAVAHDFVNNESATLSADFPTADVWTGKAHIVTRTTDPPLCASTNVVDSTFNLVVGDTGVIKGTRTWVNHATSCGPPTSEGPYTFPQFGQFTGGQFHLTDLVVDLQDVTVVPIDSSGRSATASVDGGPYHDGRSTSTWTGTIVLTCKTC